MSDWKRFWCLLTHRKHWARCNGYATDGLRCLICKEKWIIGTNGGGRFEPVEGTMP